MQPHPYALLAAAAAQQSAESTADSAAIMAAMSVQHQAIGLLNSGSRLNHVIQTENHRVKKFTAESMMNPAAAAFMSTTPALLNATALTPAPLKDIAEPLHRSPVATTTNEPNTTNSDGAR